MVKRYKMRPCTAGRLRTSNRLENLLPISSTPSMAVEPPPPTPMPAGWTTAVGQMRFSETPSRRLVAAAVRHSPHTHKNTTDAHVSTRLSC